MSDFGLRRAERSAREGSVHDQGRLILERIRSGDIDRKSVWVAAYFRHEAARLALGWCCYLHGGHLAKRSLKCREYDNAEDLSISLTQMTADQVGFGPVAVEDIKPICFRIIVAASRHILNEFQARNAGSVDAGKSKLCIESLEDFIAYPSERNLQLLQVASSRNLWVDNHWYYMACDTVTDDGKGVIDWRFAFVRCVRICSTLAEEWGLGPALGFVNEELSSWAMGNDPIKERVDARRRADKQNH